MTQYYMTKIYVDGLFNCHVMGWKRIPPNRFGSKLFPYILMVGQEHLGYKFFILNYQIIKK
jgi:hypothetical protein